MVSKIVLLFPIKILLLWNFITILLFIISPYEWSISTENYILIIIFLFSSLLFLYVGYLTGLKNNSTFHYAPPSNLISKWFNITLIIKLFWFLPSYCERLGLDLLDFKVLILRLALGFTDFGESYSLNQRIEVDSIGFSSIFIIKQLLSALTFLTIPLGIILWNKLSLIKKIVIVIFILVDVIFWMGIGTNVGVINNFLIIFFMIIVTKPNIANFSTLKTKYKIYIFGILILLLSLFSTNISQRHEFGFKGNYDIYDNRIGNAKINKENILFKISNPSIHSTIISASNYLNQGYYFTTLAFDEEFTWTYGLGNNYATLGVSQKLVGEDLLPKTYIGKLKKKGIDPLNNWHSAYLWFANDFSFFGVPFVLFFIGLLFSISWKTTLALNDPFAPAIFIFCVIEVFLLCANNQVLSFSFFTFHILMFLWVVNRFKYVKRRIPSPSIS